MVDDNKQSKSNQVETVTVQTKTIKARLNLDTVCAWWWW